MEDKVNYTRGTHRIRVSGAKNPYKHGASMSHKEFIRLLDKHNLDWEIIQRDYHQTYCDITYKIH